MTGDEELWRKIGLSNKFAICVFDTQFRLIAFNQAHNDEFFRVNGYYTRIGDVFPDLFVPEQGPVMRALMARALAGETFSVVEDFGNPVLGKPYWEITYTPLRDDAGQIIGAYHQAVDVSERLRAESARDTLEHRVAEQTTELVEQRARLRTIFETSFSFQGLLTRNGILVDSNATSLAAIGQPLEAIVGRPFWDTPWFAATPGMPDMVRDAVGRVAEGELMRQEILIDLPVGGWRWFDFAMRPMRNEAGKVIAIVPEAVETTERRHAEEALRQSQKLEAMGQLTGGVAHDFNNLLTPIIGALDMLQRSALGGERERRMIGGGLLAADRARTLVQRLLAFARRQPLRSTAVDVGALVRNMAELVASTSGPKIRLDVRIDETAICAKADPHQLEMAILNLSVNACDAMPDGGTLTITVAPDRVGPGHPSQLAPGHYVRLSIADTGVGMDTETRTRAVEPFYSTKGVGKGTGLGLSMVHGLAAQLGGGLHIESAPGKGTRIDLWLLECEQAPDEVAGQPEATAGVRGRGNILLVDDEDIVRSSTADMLEELGFHVVEAESAKQALAILDRGDTFALLITDHLMPGMSGAELARIVRDRRPTLPVLLLSGYADVAEVAPELARLGKPFKQSELSKCVGALVPLLMPAAER
ncbi:PAS domain-containing protein [uncultured Sphingomonas sp.]|uniref:hybrid sensor histidine kinase/response regulator n=1 Tax=uncultured Sphingomonas sp. TaxID=158754 RepID=UPI0035CA4A23